MRASISQGMWIPVRTASKMLGVSRQRIYELIKLGGLAWCKMDGTVLVGRNSVETRMEQRRLKNES